MKSEAAESGVRVVQGIGALDSVGSEAAALGSRALIVSPAGPEVREASLLLEIADALRGARVGQQPFPRVRRAGEPIAATLASAAEAAREGRCRLVIGLGDHEALDVARSAAAQAWIPSLLIPTGVGYGTPAVTGQLPSPDVLILDPRAGQGSPPRRTAGLGLGLFCGLIGRLASADPPADAPAEGLEAGLRALIDELPTVVRSPELPGPRVALAAGIGPAADAVSRLSPGSTPFEDLLGRIRRGGGDLGAAHAALLPAALESCGGGQPPLSRAGVARFGRHVLGIREEDDGRAALWAAGGVRQWVKSLGFGTRLPARTVVSGVEDDVLREILAVARR